MIGSTKDELRPEYMVSFSVDREAGTTSFSAALEQPTERTARIRIVNSGHRWVIGLTVLASLVEEKKGRRLEVGRMRSSS